MAQETNPTSSNSPIDRRTFVKGLSAAGLGAMLGTAASCTALSPGGKAGTAKRRVMPPAVGAPRRYAIVGAGGRSKMYQRAIQGDYSPHATLVGLCDTNQGRMELARRQSVEAGREAPPAYAPADFEKMLADNKVQTCIVTTVDGWHHEYIVRAMNAGCDVVTEKPMTTTAEKAQQILDAVARTGKKCRVTFNYRYSPPRSQVKDILMSGEIGEVRSVDFHWMLNTDHGADYFRRWHRNKVNSGGLMIHKATHHFDLVNWWLAANPLSVYSTGKREFYTPTMAKRMGLEGAHERCRTCPEKDKCNFFLDLAANKGFKELYLDNEQYDGYFRDQCVWSDKIDIEDTMNVLVKYDNNATLAYSVNAFNSWEGYTIAFNGTKGRLEHTDVESVYTNGGSKFFGPVKKKGVTTLVIPLRGAARSIEPWTGTGGHGGGDTLLLDDLFLPAPATDKYLRAADHRAGAASCLIGVAANRCFESGQPVTIAELVTGLTSPDYAPMPSRTGPLPMPPKGQRA